MIFWEGPLAFCPGGKFLWVRKVGAAYLVMLNVAFFEYLIYSIPVPKSNKLCA